MADRCAICRFYAGSPSNGECRRSPPVAVASPRHAFFPPVTADMWCGEFQAAAVQAVAAVVQAVPAAPVAATKATPAVPAKASAA